MIIESDQEKYQLDSNRWVNTLPQKKTDDTIRKTDDPIRKTNDLIRKTVNPVIKTDNSIKYPLTIILFVIGLILVSTIKNETRNLQEKINNLKASINVLKIDLHQAILDHEVITSPENISKLAKEYLEFDLISYEQSQIKQLNKNAQTLTELKKTKDKKTFKKKSKEITEKMNIKVAKKIEETKTGLRKLQDLYSKPEKIPDEIKLLIVKNIEAKKNELKQLYSEPNDAIKLNKIHKWAGVQIIKAALGLPMVPGK